MMRALFALLCVLVASPVAAQQEDDLAPPARDFESAEHLTLELRIGPYQPRFEEFDPLLGDDDGLLLSLELDVIGFRLDDILYLSGGGLIGWADYGGNAIDSDGTATSEETELEVIPLGLFAVLRFDALARKLGIPFILTGKLGYMWWHHSTETGGTERASGWSLGLGYAGQIALDLDSLDRAQARVMDEEWGINHSFLFLELHGFEPTEQSLDLGGMSWVAGLGFMM
jgi:hypothetical protein